MRHHSPGQTTTGSKCAWPQIIRHFYRELIGSITRAKANDDFIANEQARAATIREFDPWVLTKFCYTRQHQVTGRWPHFTCNQTLAFEQINASRIKRCLGAGDALTGYTLGQGMLFLSTRHDCMYFHLVHFCHG